MMLRCYLDFISLLCKFTKALAAYPRIRVSIFPLFPPSQYFQLSFVPSQHDALQPARTIMRYALRPAVLWTSSVWIQVLRWRVAGLGCQLLLKPLFLHPGSWEKSIILGPRVAFLFDVYPSPKTGSIHSSSGDSGITFLFSLV